jgi:hypothetical protein
MVHTFFVNNNEHTEELKPIAMGQNKDHFAVLTDYIREYCVDNIIMPGCLDGSKRSFRLGVMGRYGLPVLRDYPVKMKVRP